MDAQARRFIRSWVICCLFFTAAIAAFNWIMDPYMLIDVRRIPGLNARKPAVDTQQYLMKAYDVLRLKPRTLILGSSRVGIGMDAQSRMWPQEDRPVYNLGLAQGGPYEAYRYLQHATARDPVRLVLVGLEFQHFVVDEQDSTTDFEPRLVTTKEGAENSGAAREHIRDVLLGVLSLGALIDSASTLEGNLSSTSSDLTAGYWKFDTFRRSEVGGSAYPFFAAPDREFSRWYVNRPLDPRALSYVRSILDFCAAHAIRVILLLSPSHADELEVFDLAGAWNRFEDWKRDLVTLTAEYARTGARVELWDFCGYDRYSTESVPSDRESLHWFLNPNHFTRALGNVMVGRIFGAEDHDFGEMLTPENIESHLAAIREQRRQYRERSPDEAQRVRVAFASAMNDR